MVAVVELVHRLEDRPLRIGAVGGRRAEFLADQAGRLGRDALALAADDRERRAVVHHHHRLDVDAGVLVAKADQRVHVAGADIVGARRHARDRLARAVAGVDRHIQALGLEVPLVEGDRERRGGALEAPVEREFDRRLRLGRTLPPDVHTASMPAKRAPLRTRNTPFISSLLGMPRYRDRRSRAGQSSRLYALYGKCFLRNDRRPAAHA